MPPRNSNPEDLGVPTEDGHWFGDPKMIEQQASFERHVAQAEALASAVANDFQAFMNNFQKDTKKGLLFVDIESHSLTQSCSVHPSIGVPMTSRFSF